MQRRLLEFFEEEGIPRELVEFRESEGRVKWHSFFECFIDGQNTQISWTEWKTCYDTSTVPFKSSEIEENYIFQIIKQNADTPTFEALKKRVKRKLFFGMLRRIKELEEKIMELEYAPGGNIAKDAQKHFEELAGGD